MILADDYPALRNLWYRISIPIVSGKSYDTVEPIGRQVWERVEWTLEKYKLFDREESAKSQFILEESESVYGKKYLTKVRYGQSAFRVKLTDAYTRKCSISGEKTLPVL